jgi:hypothetical protein
MIKCGAIRGRNPENPKSREAGINTEQQLELRKDEKTNCLTSVQKDNVIVNIPNKSQTILSTIYKENLKSMKKRNKKGYLFTIGDEQLLGSLPKNSIENVFGDKSSIQNDIPIEDLFAMVSRDYEVFHIIVEEGSNCRYDPQAVIDSWTKVIGQRAIPLSDITKLSETIVSTIQVVEGEDKTKVSTSWKNGSKVVERAIANINKSDIVLDDGITTL